MSTTTDTYKTDATMELTKNRETSQREQIDFAAAPIGARWFVYYKAGTDESGKRHPHLHKGDTLTTWMGDHLATITEIGTAWRDNMGSWRQWITARTMGTDGTMEWRGTAYLTAGDYARIKRFA